MKSATDWLKEKAPVIEKIRQERAYEAQRVKDLLPLFEGGDWRCRCGERNEMDALYCSACKADEPQDYFYTLAKETAIVEQKKQACAYNALDAMVEDEEGDPDYGREDDA